MSLEKLKSPLTISIVIYITIVIVVFLSNISTRFYREKHMLFYYILAIIIPILIYVFVLGIFF